MNSTKCDKCKQPIEGYEGIVHTCESWKDRKTETWCEDCCIEHGMCKCDGCSEEFAEEFEMPRIDGCLFCVPCAREKTPKHFDKTPIFIGLNDEI